MTGLKGNLRILVIDDNPSIHDDFLKILKPKESNANMKKAKEALFGKQHADDLPEIPHFDVDSAYQGREGLDLVKESINNKKPYAVMFVDIRMPPGWDGIETIQKIWEVDKDIQVVICTAHFDFSWSDMIKKFKQTDQLLILKKPFDNIEVLQFASSLTKKWQLQQQIKSQIHLLNDLVNQRTFELKSSLSITRAALESTTDGIIVVSNEGEIIDYNKKFVNLWQIPEKILKERSYQKLLNYLSKQINGPEHFLEKEKEIRNYSEIEFYQEIKLINGNVIECYNLPHRVDSTIIGRVINFRDVTSSRQIETQLQHLATFDTLTELPNRTLLMDRIHHSISLAQRNSTLIALLFLDIDQFKTVNDSLGHTIGDMLLKELSNRLMQFIRESDTIARFGGDEFVILLTGLIREEDAIPVVQNLMNIVSFPFQISGHELRVSASIGISFYPTNSSNAETLLKNADLAMYRVKVTGRNNYEFFTQKMNANLVKRLHLKTSLFKALENDEFRIYYQPIYDLNTRKIVATEALLRWQHPELGLLLPDEFITIAEDIGLILKIGDWVLKTACKQNTIWHQNNIGILPVAVNISSLQLHYSNFVESITKILDDAKLNPECLELELTESLIIHDTETVIKSMNDIKKLGVKFTIDDFGTGYSCLSYLRRLPISKLKIDKSFVENIKMRSEDVTVIIAIINLAHNLNLRVVGEGVETKEQLDFLVENNCDEVQGYYFCQPLPVDEYTKFIFSNKSD